MISAYIFSLVVGGGLLTLSLFGDLFGGDAELDAGADIDVDADGIGDGAEIAKLLSLRSLVYALFGFGGSGLVLSFTLGGGLVTGMIALAMGLGSGALVGTVFGYLKRTEAGQIQGEAELSGLTGEVLLPIGPGETGEVRIRSGDRRYRIRARADDESGPDAELEAGRAIMVVDVKEGVARVAPVRMKLLRDE